MVYYRKYRSQTLNELDIEKIRQSLLSILSAKDIPHAFLFTGPKGLGKTSTARILAKAINCRHKTKGSVEPCNSCDICISITNGSNVDVIEIDGASNRGIDEVRDLREKVRYAPVSAENKVYIIDEVHMLTSEAFNALLKTIEEPPAHTMFIFCTTEPQKVPATILSRCFHIPFTPATNEELLRALKRVIDAEKIIIEDSAIQLITELADGGFRDAIKMLEETVLSAKGEKITRHVVEKIYSAYDVHTVIYELFGNLQKKDLKGSLTLIEKLVDQGVDNKYFLTQMLNLLHGLLLQSNGIKTKGLVLKNTGLTMNEIVELIALFTRAYSDMKYAVLPQIPVEIAIVTWIQNMSENHAVSKNVNKPTISDLMNKQKLMQVKRVLEPGKLEEVTTQTAATHEQRDIHSVNDNEKSLLENLIYKTKPYNHSVAAVLRGCVVTAFTDEGIVLKTSYKFHKERLEEHKTKEVIEKAIKEVTGKSIPFQVLLKNK